MCGVCGIYSISRDICHEDAIPKMVGSLKHRGPDDDGWEIIDGPAGERLSLGNTRLSVIDTSPLGHQPMTSDDGALTLVYNGEIYNFPELRSILLGKGFTFRSGSDTEVLLCAYREWGPRALDFLKGMFAFAIWDARRAELFLARDRLGKKPLYYAARGGIFAFASEIKALIAAGLVERRVDPAGLADFLSYQFTMSPRTIFRDVRKVEPGTSITVRQGTMRQSVYWSLRDIRPAADPLPIAHYEEGLEIRIREAVRRRLISDVPLGVFLSGGLDSSLIAGLVSGMTGERIRTFSLGFQSEEEQAFSELRHARTVAQHFGTEHHEYLGTPEDIAGEVEKIAWHFDEPFGNGLHTYFVSRLARAHVTVALSGLGGDELFAGYEWNRMAKLITLYRRTPKSIRRYVVEPALAALDHNTLPGSYLGKLKKLFLYSNLDDREWYPLWIGVFHPESVGDLLTDGYTAPPDGYDPRTGFREHWEDAAPRGFQDRLLYLQMRTTMLDDFLNYTDRMSMAHSLECRTPFLDHELVEYSTEIPFIYKMPGFEGKHILRRVAKKILPADIVARKKQPFLLPLDMWMRGPLKPLVLDLLLGTGSTTEDILDGEKVKLLADDFFERGMPLSRQVWSLFTLKLWESVFLKSRKYEGAVAELHGKAHEEFPH